MMTDHANRTTHDATTPLERFIDFLQTQEELTGLTEHGTENVRACVRAALPFIPAVVLAGHWHDCLGDSIADPIVRAIDAMKEADRQHALTGFEPDGVDDPVDVQTREHRAHYITGLLVGLALANVLREPRGGR